MHHHKSEDLSEDEKTLTGYLREKEENTQKSGYPEWTILSDVTAFSNHHQSARVRNAPMTRRGYLIILKGDDVPMHLMELKAFQKEKWEALKETLVKFGKRSGLFQSIDVKNPEGPGGPFQLRVKVRGPQRQHR